MSEPTSFQDVTAGLFWGKGIRKDRVIPKQDMVRVQKFIENPNMFKDKLDDMVPVLQEALKLSPNVPGLADSLNDVDQTFRNMIKLLMKVGLWPTYDSHAFLDAINENLGEKKFAAEASETTIHNYDRWVKVFPKILAAAHRNLVNYKDPNALNEFRKIVHDVVFGQDGIFNKIEAISKTLNQDVSKQEDSEEDHEKSGLSNKVMAEKIRWFHEEGQEAIRKALSTTYERKVLQAGDRKKVYDGAFAIQLDTVGKEWGGRIVKALKEHGFDPSGVFDPRKFEGAQRRYESLAKLSTEELTGNASQEMEGTYKAFKNALALYDKDPKKKEEVIDAYYMIVLHGKRNAYTSLADMYNKLKGMDVDSLPAAGAGKTEEVPAPAGEKAVAPTSEKENTPEAVSPETAAPEEVAQPSETPPKADSAKKDPNGEATRDVAEVTEEDNFFKNIEKNLGTKADNVIAEYLLKRTDGDLTTAAASAFINKKLLPEYHKQGMRPEAVAALDNRLSSLSKMIRGHLLVPKKYLDKPELLKKVFSTRGSVAWKLYKIMLGAAKANNSISSVASEVKGLKASDLVKELAYQEKRMQETVKSEPKKEKVKETQPPEDKATTPVAVTPENVVEKVEDVVEKTAPQSQLSPEGQKTIQEAVTVVDKVLDTTEQSSTEKEKIVQQVEDTLEQAIQKLENEQDIGEVSTYVTKVLESLRRALGSNNEKDGEKDRLLKRITSLMSRVQGAVGTLGPEGRDKLQDSLDRFQGTFTNIHEEYKDHLSDLQDKITVIRDKMQIGSMLGEDVSNKVLPAIKEALGTEETSTPVSETVAPEAVPAEQAVETKDTPQAPEEKEKEKEKEKDSPVVTPDGYAKGIANLSNKINRNLASKGSSPKKALTLMKPILVEYLSSLEDKDNNPEESLPLRVVNQFAGALESPGASEEEFNAKVVPFIEGLKKFVEGFQESEQHVEQLDKALASIPVLEEAKTANTFFTRKASTSGKSTVVNAALLQFLNKRGHQ
jgi:hypothetical protein